MIVLEVSFPVTKLKWFSRQNQAILEQNDGKIVIYISMGQKCVISSSKMSGMYTYGMYT